MVFDNGSKVSKLNIIRYLSFLSYAIFIGFLTLSGLFNKPVLGIGKNSLIILFSVIYIIYVVYVYIRNYNFFKYNDEGGKLVFRFISLRPFDNKKRSIEIVKKKFTGYKIRNSFLNIKVDLLLSVKTRNGVANYPPISITALTNKEKEYLKTSLNQAVG